MLFTSVRGLMPHILRQYALMCLGVFTIITFTWFLPEIASYIGTALFGTPKSRVSDSVSKIVFPLLWLYAFKIGLYEYTMPPLARRHLPFLTRGIVTARENAKNMVRRMVAKTRMKKSPEVVLDVEIYLAGINSPSAVLGRVPYIVIPVSFLQNFSPGEQEPVLAHELCHIKHREGIPINVEKITVRVMLFYCILQGGIIASSIFGVVPVREVPQVFITLVISYLTLIVAVMIALANNRCREYLNDAGAIGLVGWHACDNFVSVLRAVGESSSEPPVRSWWGLLSTHPHTERRIATLMRRE